MGPTATDAPEVAPQIPMALARSVGSVNTVVKMAKVAGKMKAAATPIDARAAIREAVDVASAAHSDVAMNPTRPICITGFRPRRSATAPPASNSAANGRL